MGNDTILNHSLELFAKLFKETILVVNDPKDFTGPDLMVVTDIIPARCSLAGLHTGLFYASFPWSYVLACDVPFASEAIIRYLLSNRKPGKEIIIPRTREGIEPLSALYHKSCLPFIERNLAENRFMIKKFFRPRKVWEIQPQELEKIDPQMRFKFNVNTPQDLAMARTMAGQGNENIRT